MTKIYPVVHHANNAQAAEQAEIALDAGCDGVFLISHTGNNTALLPLANRLKSMSITAGRPFDIGVNLLGVEADLALRVAGLFKLDMVWLDKSGIGASGFDLTGRALVNAWNALPADERPIVFAGVAFKYQPDEPNPPMAASFAAGAGFVPTTSGPGTGHAPDIRKILEMSQATDKRLAIASGMSVDNVADFSPYLSHVLVATGVSRNESEFDYELLHAFVAKVRGTR